jgi:hypothetical protein
MSMSVLNVTKAKALSEETINTRLGPIRIARIINEKGEEDDGFDVDSLVLFMAQLDPNDITKPALRAALRSFQAEALELKVRGGAAALNLRCARMFEEAGDQVMSSCILEMMALRPINAALAENNQ